MGISEVSRPAALAGGRVALVVVDVQNDFCDPAGAYAEGGYDMSMIAPMLQQVTRLIGGAHEAGLPILFTRLEYPLDDSGRALSMSWKREEPKALSGLDSRLAEGSWGAQLLPTLPLPDGSSVVIKHSYSAYFDTRLDTYLTRHGVETVILCGLASNGCLMHTAFDAHVRGYRVVIPWDATASYWADLHDSAFRILDNMVADLRTTDDLDRELSSLTAVNRGRP
jgi:ureidoacrylate peracid hydrolase